MCSLIVLTLLMLTPSLLDADQPTQRVSLEDELSDRFVSPIKSLNWLDARRLLVVQADGVRVLELNETTEGKTVKWEWNTLSRYGKASSVSVTPGDRFILLNYAPNKLSPKSTYRIFDTKTQTFNNVGPTKSGEEDVRVLVWNPGGDDFAYVHDNEVYFQQSPAAEHSLQLTPTAKNGSSSADLLNGVADWLYEEEILEKSAQTLWWSLDGEFLAFLTIDNRMVTHVPISHYGHRQYPFVMRQSYPHTGEEHLPEVWLNMWRKKDREMRRLRVDSIDQSARTYFFSATWLKLHGQQVLSAVWANRYQNQIVFSLCTFASGQCVPNLVQKYAFAASADSDAAAPPLRLWAEPKDSRAEAHVDDAFYTLLPHRRPNGGNVYTHLAIVNVPIGLIGGREAFLAMGDFDVEKINGLDRKRRKIYYTAAAPKPSQRHLFVSPSFATSDIAAEPICLSCNISTNCTFHDSSLADVESGGFVALSCKGPGTPFVLVARLNAAEDRLEPVLEFGRNEALEKALHTHRLPSVHFERVKFSNGVETFVKLLVPYGAQLKSQRPERKLPVLVYVYAGPGYQKVTEEWLSKNTLNLFFVSGMEYIVVSIDGRGSGHQGWRMKQPIYGNLGTVEVDDQISTVRELIRRYPLLDEKRIGIWGRHWLFYDPAPKGTSLLDLYEDISVAPVSNWKFYESSDLETMVDCSLQEGRTATEHMQDCKLQSILVSISDYSLNRSQHILDATHNERYIGDAGPEAYERADLSIDVRPFHNVSFLLVHGSADDNVHYHHTAEFVRALTKDNVQFRLMVYTDESHYLVGVRLHLDTMLAEFFQSCLGGK